MIAELPVNNFPNLSNDNSDLPFFNENDTVLPIVNMNDNLNIVNIDIMNPQSVNIEDEAIDNTIPLIENTQDVEEPNMRIPRDDAELVADEELANEMIERRRLLEILGGRGGAGRPPTTLKGFLKSNERLRNDVVKMREIGTIEK